MKIEIDINIDNYLSEQDKKELIKEVFKERIEQELFKSRKGTVQSDAEIQRIIGNIAHEIVMVEVQKYIPNCEQLIKDKVVEAINKDNTIYHRVFEKKDLWGREQSLALDYIEDVVRNNKSVIADKAKQAIEDYNYSDNISEQISNHFAEVANQFNNLSEYFYNKRKDDTTRIN